MWSEFFSGVRDMLSNSLRSHRYFLSLGSEWSLAAGRTLGLQPLSLGHLQMSSHGLPGLRGAGEKPIFFFSRESHLFFLAGSF